MTSDTMIGGTSEFGVITAGSLTLSGSTGVELATLHVVNTKRRVCMRHGVVSSWVSIDDETFCGECMKGMLLKAGVMKLLEVDQP